MRSEGPEAAIREVVNGNQTSRGTDTYKYDHENRLTQSVIGGVTFSSVYNADGLRMSHTEGVTTTK